MTPETALKNKVRIRLSELGYIPLRLNVGMLYDINGNAVNLGLPKGCSDILAVQPVTGRSVFIETKIHPRKPTPEQINFIHIMQRQGALAGVVYDLTELEKLLGVKC